jgi:pre-mRNA-splicing factor RBM22/SLT11
MSREPFGSACHVCARPMSKFRWKAGSGGRFKQTVVCAACAKMKNVCMCCILDLTYGVPVEVRDRVVTQAIAGQLGIPGGPGGEGVSLAGGGGGSAAPLALPGSITAPLLGYNAGGATAVSDYNRAYAMVTAEQAEAKGGAVVPYSGLASVAPAAHEALLRLGRTKPRYDRNAAKLCSFFARGECKRGSECPYRHEMPADKAEGLSKQNYKDRCVWRCLALLLRAGAVHANCGDACCRSIDDGRLGPASAFRLVCARVACRAHPSLHVSVCSCHLPLNPPLPTPPRLRPSLQVLRH